MDMERVRADVADLISYIPRLAELLPPGSVRTADDGEHPKVSASPLPWNNSVAGVFMDIHAVRSLEAGLSLLAHGHATIRGGSDANTKAALDALPDLIAFVALHRRDSELPEQAARRLRHLGRQARVVLDELRHDEEPWHVAPGGLLCPNQPGLPDDGAYCDNQLMLPPGFATMRAPGVYCPTCRDENGRRMSWPYDAWTLVLTEGA